MYRQIGRDNEYSQIFRVESLLRHPLARLSTVWRDNIQIDDGEIWYEHGRWMKVPQNYVKLMCSVLTVFKIWLLLSFSC